MKPAFALEIVLIAALVNPLFEKSCLCELLLFVFYVL